MINFLKGIAAGLGGVAPGLSGSVLLIILGLYQDVLEALGTIFKDFKKKILFLLPVVAGMGAGVLLFSKVLNFLLSNYEMPTRFCFLGLILGTVPMFYREVKKEGFSGKYYLVILLAAAVGTWMFTVNKDAFAQIADPTLLQSVILGVAVAATAIIPGVDPAVLLSSIGYYEMYVRSLANLDFGVLIPMAAGVAVGAVGLSFLMSVLFKRLYTATFSVVFGLFLSMIPNMLNESCVLGWNGETALSIIVMAAGFLISFYLGDIEGNHQRVKKMASCLKRRMRRRD